MKKILIRINSFILCIVMCLVAVTGVFFSNASAAENYNGGWAITRSTQTVWTDPSKTSKRGTIYANEGFTVLSQSGNYMKIEYSTSQGAKRGYLVNPDVQTAFLDRTCVGNVNANKTLYYGNNSSEYVVSGSVYAGEYIAVLGRNNGWLYVEYNVSDGTRKRGYMTTSNVTLYNDNNIYDLYTYENPGNDFYVGYTEVLSGPGSAYPSVGSVGTKNSSELEHVKYYYTYTYGNGAYMYIEYIQNSTGKKKSGFIYVIGY